MAVGGIAIRGSNIIKVKCEVQQICHHYRITTEVKWEKLRKIKFDAYKAIVDYFFSLQEANLLQYHCIIADNTRFNYQAVDNCSKKTILPRIYYQLIKWRCLQQYGEKFNIHIRPDKSNMLDKLHEQQNTLNAHHAHAPIQSIECRDSSSCFMLQMNDLILGSIGYIRNNRHKRLEAASSKNELALYILGRTGLMDYSRDTERKGKFTVEKL